MDNLNDLKAIWLTAKTDGLPASAEVVEVAKKYRNKGLRKKVLLIVFAGLLTALMIVVVFIYKSTMITTRIGEVCMILSGIVLLSTNIRSIGRFYRFTDYTNKEFIQFLEQTRVNQARYYNKTQVVGLWFSTTGLALYLYESLRINVTFGLVMYALCGITLGVTWFYIRPRTYRKNAAKLDETLKHLEKIADQIK